MNQNRCADLFCKNSNYSSISPLINYSISRDLSRAMNTYHWLRTLLSGKMWTSLSRDQWKKTKNEKFEKLKNLRINNVKLECKQKGFLIQVPKFLLIVFFYPQIVPHVVWFTFLVLNCHPYDLQKPWWMLQTRNWTPHKVPKRI